jgi:hypothetical protein
VTRPAHRDGARTEPGADTPRPGPHTPGPAAATTPGSPPANGDVHAPAVTRSRLEAEALLLEIADAIAQLETCGLVRVYRDADGELRARLELDWPG